MIDLDWQEENVDFMVKESLKYWLQFEEYSCDKVFLEDLRKRFVKEYCIVDNGIDEVLDLDEIPFLFIKDVLPNGDYLLAWDYETVRFEYD